MLSGQFTNKTLRRWTDRQTCAVLVVYYTSLTSIGMQKLHIFAFHLTHRSLTYHKIYFFTPGGTKIENAKFLLYSRVHNHRTEQLLIYFPLILKINILIISSVFLSSSEFFVVLHSAANNNCCACFDLNACICIENQE